MEERGKPVRLIRHKLVPTADKDIMYCTGCKQTFHRGKEALDHVRAPAWKIRENRIMILAEMLIVVWFILIIFVFHIFGA